MAIVEKKTIEQRISLLNKAGLQHDEALKSYVLKDNSVLMSDIEEMDEAEWNDSFSALMDDLRKGASESTDVIVKRELAGMADSDIVDLMKIIKDKDVMELAIHKKQIQKFKRKFLGNDKLVFTTVDDKATYDQVLVAWQTVKNYRTKQIEPDKKKRTSVLTAAIQFYNQKFNPLAEDAKKIEAPLGVILDDWDKKIKDKKEEDKRKLAEQEALRTKQIEATGAVLDMGTGFYFLSAPEFEIPEVSIGATDINKISDELFEKFIKQFTETNALIIAAKEKKRVENEAETERLRLKKEQEDNEREEEKKELAKMRVDTRSEVLELIGMVLSEDKTEYFFNDIKVSIKSIGESEKPAWEILLAETKDKIKEAKDNLEKEQVKKLRLASRPADLEKLGFKLNPSGVTYHHDLGLSQPTKGITDISDEDWKEILKTASDQIQSITAKNERCAARRLKVIELGFTEISKYFAYSYKGVKFDLAADFAAVDNWENIVTWLIEKTKSIDAAIALQSQRYEKLAPYAEYGPEANMQELYKLEDAIFIKLFDDKKAAKEKKLNDDIIEKETNRKKEEADNLAKASDEAKLQHIIDNLPDIPEMESPEYKKIAELISKKYDEIRALKK